MISQDSDQNSAQDLENRFQQLDGQKSFKVKMMPIMMSSEPDTKPSVSEPLPKVRQSQISLPTFIEIV